MNAALTKSTITLTLAAAVLVPFAVAHADRVGQLEGTPKIVVNYDDVDISNPQGLSILYSRIQYAAMNICGYDRLHKELSRQRRPEACYRAAVDDAINQVNQPVLTAYHRAKSKSVPG